MPAMSLSSNSDICRAPPSSSALIAGARNAVIQSSPAGLISSLIRAWVITPRSSTRTTWSRPKRSFSGLRSKCLHLMSRLVRPGQE